MQNSCVIAEQVGIRKEKLQVMHNENAKIL